MVRTIGNLGRNGRRTVLAAMCLIALGIGTNAQTADPPNRLGQPLVAPSGLVRGDAMLPAPPLRPDDLQYGDLHGDRLKSLLMEVDAISLADRDRGTVFWGRNVGTQGHVDTENWVQAQFTRLGLSDVHRVSFDLSPQWMASSYAIAFTGGGKTLRLASARPARSGSTPAGGSEWPLVWGGEGTEADFAGRDVRGKAVLIQDLLLPGDIRHSAQLDRVVERAFDHGAAAVGLIFGISDNFAMWPATGGRPGFSVGFEDGKVLRDLLGAGQDVRVKLDLQSEMRPGLTTASVFGSLPGTTGEDITILAHMDGYFEGALDNASGLAVLIGLAEHFAKVPAAARRRTIRFVGSAGHHGGPGARWFHDNKDAALAHTVLAINLEHVAAVRTQYWGNHLRQTTGVSPMRWWVWGSRPLLDVVRDSFSRFNVGVTADMDPGASGEMGAMDHDVPSIQVITSPEIKHTEQDTPEWVPATGLEEIARAYARIIDQVNALDRAALQPGR
jgi:Peptidase family M28